MLKLIKPKVNFIKKLEDKFLKISEKKEMEFNKFVRSNKSKNLKCKNIIKENLNNLAKDKMLSYHIDKKAIENNLIPILVTSTVRAKMHKNRSISAHVRNIKTSYKSLNKFHSNILKEINQKLKYKVNFIKTIEPHQSFIPHSHTLYYIKKEDIKEFKKILANKKKLNVNIGKTDIKPINKDLDSINGIKKYIEYLYKTTAKTKNMQEIKVIDGYKKLTSVVLYARSRTKITKQHLRYLSWYFGNSRKAISDYKDLGYGSVIEAIENKCDIVGEDGKSINKVKEPLLTLYLKDKIIINSKTGEVLFDGNNTKNIINSKIKRFKGCESKKSIKSKKTNFKAKIGGLNRFYSGIVVIKMVCRKVVLIYSKKLINILLYIHLLNKIR